MKATLLALGALFVLSAGGPRAAQAADGSTTRRFGEARAARIVQYRNGLVTRILQRNGIAYRTGPHGVPVAVLYDGHSYPVERIGVAPYWAAPMGHAHHWHPRHVVSLQLPWGSLVLEGW